LRHIQALEEGGFVKTYEEKSHLGAPNRKYYFLSSTISLTISMSQDSFTIANNQLIKKWNLGNSDNDDINGSKLSSFTPNLFIVIAVLKPRAH
jgi:predicted transcriptional regulator